jgi:hypothetical protein
LEVTIIREGTGAVELTVNENKQLAVTTNLRSLIYKQISRQELLSEPGILIKDGKAEKWKCSESLEFEEKLIFPGPYYDGSTLADTTITIDLLLNLTRAYQILKKENLAIDNFYSPGIFILNTDGILFFPSNLLLYITNQLSENEKARFWQPYNHPDATDEQKVSFVLGVLAYYLLTNSYPYSGTSVVELREKMRSSKPVEIEFLKPGIKNDIADLINQSLALKNIKLEEWIKQLEIWKQNGVEEPISESEKKQIQKSAAKKKETREKQFLRNQFFSRNWKTIGIIIVIIAVVFSFTIGPVRNALEPPVTTGMSAKEVVNTYYKAIIDMNTEIMEDCLNKKVGKADITEVTQLYIISRVRTGYEGKSGLISAQDWNDGLITKINPGEQVYGIADLEVKQSSNNIFYADYIRWYPEISDDPDSVENLPPIKSYIRDIVSLEKIKDVWIIVKLERNTKE